MDNLEKELKDLKETNNELAQKAQYWKMTAAQRENEKLELKKEINELRLKLSRIRNYGNVQANNLDAALQSASQKALSHLVTASSEIARTMELAKAYLNDREELDAVSPPWSSIGGTPTSVKKDRVHRVPPLMMGGQSIQPVVALTMLNTSNPRSTNRSPNPNRNVTRRAVPMHMLQDVYIPLTRIDARDMQARNMETEPEAISPNNSTEDLGLDDREERVIEESLQMSEDEDFDTAPTLHAVTEEPEDVELTPPRCRVENPLEGPSWMLDASANNQRPVTEALMDERVDVGRGEADVHASATKTRTNLEPDSTTEVEETRAAPPSLIVDNTDNQRNIINNERSPGAFSPTVRRHRKRPACRLSPRDASNRRTSTSGRVLKVLVAKMRLEGSPPPAWGPGSPAARAAPPLEQFDAPSPNGATVAGVIVSETRQSLLDENASGEPAPVLRPHSRDILPGRADASPVAECGPSRYRSTSRHDDSSSRVRSRRASETESDSSGEAGEGRTRRARKVVTYKEKPLNRKMRR